MKTPEKKATRPELKIEVDTLLAEAKLKFEDLNREDAFKRQLFEYATVVAEGSSVKPFGVRFHFSTYSVSVPLPITICLTVVLRTI